MDILEAREDLRLTAILSNLDEIRVRSKKYQITIFSRKSMWEGDFMSVYNNIMGGLVVFTSIRV